MAISIISHSISRVVDPIVEHIDFVVRMAIIRDRLSPSLPESRIDIVCESPLLVNLTVEQYNTVFELIMLLRKTILNLTQTEPQVSVKSGSQPSLPVTPVVVPQSPRDVPASSPALNTESPKPSKPILKRSPSSKSPKGWITWVVNNLRNEEDQDTEPKWVDK